MRARRCRRPDVFSLLFRAGYSRFFRSDGRPPRAAFPRVRAARSRFIRGNSRAAGSWGAGVRCSEPGFSAVLSLAREPRRFELRLSHFEDAARASREEEGVKCLL